MNFSEEQMLKVSTVNTRTDFDLVPLNHRYDLKNKKIINLTSNQEIPQKICLEQTKIKELMLYYNNNTEYINDKLIQFYNTLENTINKMKSDYQQLNKMVDLSIPDTLKNIQNELINLKSFTQNSNYNNYDINDKIDNLNKSVSNIFKQDINLSGKINGIHFPNTSGTVITTNNLQHITNLLNVERAIIKNVSINYGFFDEIHINKFSNNLLDTLNIKTKNLTISDKCNANSISVENLFSNNIKSHIIETTNLCIKNISVDGICNFNSVNISNEFTCPQINVNKLLSDNIETNNLKIYDTANINKLIINSSFLDISDINITNKLTSKKINTEEIIIGNQVINKDTILNFINNNNSIESQYIDNIEINKLILKDLAHCDLASIDKLNSYNINTQQLTTQKILLSNKWEIVIDKDSLKFNKFETTLNKWVEKYNVDKLLDNIETNNLKIYDTANINKLIINSSFLDISDINITNKLTSKKINTEEITIGNQVINKDTILMFINNNNSIESQYINDIEIDKLILKDLSHCDIATINKLNSYNINTQKLTTQKILLSDKWEIVIDEDSLKFNKFDSDLNKWIEKYNII